jgi:hypothetical protein
MMNQRSCELCEAKHGLGERKKLEAFQTLPEAVCCWKNGVGALVWR